MIAEQSIKQTMNKIFKIKTSDNLHYFTTWVPGTWY